jgi:hypothetical protein
MDRKKFNDLGGFAEHKGQTEKRRQGMHINPALWPQYQQHIMDAYREDPFQRVFSSMPYMGMGMQPIYNPFGGTMMAQMGQFQLYNAVSLEAKRTVGVR